MTARPSIARLADCAPTARDRASADLQARARAAVTQIINDRARWFTVDPRRLDVLETTPFQPPLSSLLPRQLRYRIAVLIGEEIAKPRRLMGLGGEVPLINLKGAAIYAERLCDLAEAV